MLAIVFMISSGFMYFDGMLTTVEACTSQYLSDYNMHVLTNAISGVESYHQTYADERNWGSYANAYANTSNEVSITIGWAQNYGESARTLLQMIQKEYPDDFAKYDTAGIADDLNHSWTSAPYYQPSKTSVKGQAIIAIITSDGGKKCQDEFFAQLMEKYLKNAVDFGVPVTNPEALCFFCEIEHLGGLKPAQRIFTRCNGDYSADSIMASLKQDQNDSSSSQQVGDSIFWSRHECCYKWFNQYLQVKNYLALGDTGDAVKQLQYKLDILGFECGNADGDYGQSTFFAVMDFQKVYGLDTDGVCGLQTQAKIDEAYANRPALQGTGFVEQFLNSLKDVTAIAKVHGYTYGDSKSIPPTVDKYISCDRMVAKALYDMSDDYGFRDMTAGGWTGNGEEAYLLSHGFRKVTDVSKLQAGDIVAVGTNGTDEHTFVINSYDASSKLISKYDEGDQWRIDSVQPFTNVKVIEWAGRSIYAVYRYKTVSDPVDPVPAPKVVTNKNVLIGQKWLNYYYPKTLNSSIGKQLEEDGIYGNDSRNACLGIWKYMANKKTGSSLTLSNHNFGDSCKSIAKRMSIKEGASGTLTLVAQLILSAKGFYSGDMDTNFGSQTTQSVKDYQSAHSLEADGVIGADTWYSFFND
jgi:peptidoglycan hydrolase-like protein with peptidoglycan-binding domain